MRLWFCHGPGIVLGLFHLMRPWVFYVFSLSASLASLQAETSSELQNPCVHELSSVSRRELITFDHPGESQKVYYWKHQYVIKVPKSIPFEEEVLVADTLSKLGYQKFLGLIDIAYEGDRVHRGYVVERVWGATVQDYFRFFSE